MINCPNYIRLNYIALFLKNLSFKGEEKVDYPRIRNIEAFPTEMSGQKVVCLRDPLRFTDNMLFVPFNVFYIINMFDGQHSILDIQTAYSRKYRDLLFSDRLKEIMDQLDSYLFLESDRFNQAKRNMEQEFKDSQIRKASHAGSAYQEDPEALRSQLGSFFSSPEGPGQPVVETPSGELKGGISPHIDFSRGGVCSAWAYKEVAERCDADVFVIFGTGHFAVNMFAVTSKDFGTPLGIVRSHRDFIGQLGELCEQDIFEDEFAHRTEHSIEFQVLFLQYLFGGKKDIRIVPILCGSFNQMMLDGRIPCKDEHFTDFVEALRITIDEWGEKVCFIAGVDLAHMGQKFGDQGALIAGFVEWVEDEDKRLLDFVGKVDMDGFFHSISKDNDRRRICGFSSICTMLSVMNAKEGRVLKYDKAVDNLTQSVVSFTSVAFY